MFDWQAITVGIVVLFAALFVARRAYHYVRSFSKSGGSSCATGCGACGSADQPAAQKTSPIIQITRSASPPRRKTI